MEASVSRRSFLASSGAALATTLMLGCGTGRDEGSAVPDEAAEQAGIDYMALVNKTHELPEGWEDAVEIVHFTNTEDWDVDVEAKAYDAYLLLKEDLEADDVYVDLDSAYRSVAAQQEIVEDFTKKYGAEYVKRYVAVPGYSEHHTGLALDLFLIVNGKGVYKNEEMVLYPELWDKIHAKLADHGFVLRYLPQKMIETGYSYEPWHIRYLDDVDAAATIMEEGITLERYLGAIDPMTADAKVDYGSSELYTESDIDSALGVVLAEFTGWTGCTLKRIAYAGDDACTAEELSWLNELREANHPDDEEFDQSFVFTSDFRSPSEKEAEGTAWEPNADYNGWTWHLGRAGADGAWRLMTWGY